ncbi:M23 family metallopeptidase [Alkalicella caledoniensis]|uniref:M23 family metallopeptidase n=1 Tax=Alkalicella caledoniensis TaxID=2731377 RepID=A0A7G9W8K3_ALKCA|nr:M23 family metallopeptidase [Alkalicella caledoniensis]QNO15015.1 M23 family metallopeptidase [Alkalicella caledoniensis]
MSSKGKNNKFTIMVIPHSEGTPLVFKLPISTVQLIGVLILAVVMVSISFVTRYVDISKSMDELDYLRQENIAKESKIEELAKETQLLIEKFEEIKELEEKLKNLANIEDEAKGVEKESSIDEKLFVNSRGTTTLERASRSVNHLNNLLPNQRDAMSEMVGDIEETNRRLASTPSIWPTWGRISSPFGNRRGPFTGRIEFHSGIDIANSTGTPIYATADGSVSVAAYRSGWGNLVIIEHSNGFSTYYAHMSRIAVKPWEKVEKGQIIGYVGSTGNSTGPHLHYEVRLRGTPVNPRNYMN